MYCVKHTRPDIMNPVRELSKLLGTATEAAYKEMKRVIKYVIDSEALGLRMQPRLSDNKWMIEVYSDSDWAGDPEDRQSVGRYIIFVNGVPVVTWKSSRSQKSMALSSSEAEMYACSEAVRELPFIAEILLFFNAKVITPFKV